MSQNTLLRTHARRYAHARFHTHPNALYYCGRPPCRYILLVDCRDYESYEEKHISVARHLSLLDGIDRVRYDVAVYYDEDGAVDGPAWKARVAHIAAAQEADPDYDETVENLSVLAGGWTKFILDYPTLCITEKIYHPRKLKELNTLPAGRNPPHGSRQSAREH